jgi:hypothetical protein
VLKSNWHQILLQCKENVATRVQPMLRTAREPQPDLGVGAGGDHTKLVEAPRRTMWNIVRHNVSFTLVSEEAASQKTATNLKTLCHGGPCCTNTNFMRVLPFYVRTVRFRISSFSGLCSQVTDLVHATPNCGTGRARQRTKKSPPPNHQASEAVIS